MLTKNKGRHVQRGLGFETKVKDNLTKRGVVHSYQPTPPIPYTIEHTYTPDFQIGDIRIEVKGFFLAEDRRKHIELRRNNSSLDIRFVFQNPNTPVEGAVKRKCGTKLTNGEWATKNNFKWAAGTVPDEWINETKNRVHRK
jgi:Phage endonuclease I